MIYIFIVSAITMWQIIINYQTKKEGEKLLKTLQQYDKTFQNEDP